MARDPKTLRKAYEYKLGKDLVSKLSDAQIKKLSQYYNSLPPKEQSKVDSDLIKGKGDFLEVARGMAEGIVDGEVASVSEADKKKFTKKEDKIPEGLDDLLNDIKNEIDEKVPEGLDDLLKDIQEEVKEIKEDTDNIPEGLDDLLNDIQKEVEDIKEEVPKGLDDLLDEIRKEDKTESGKNISALVKYEGTKDEDIVDEEIDQSILELLGLTDVSDIDYSTYKTLLRERLIAGGMVDSQIPTEEIELLTNEYKRVKSKTGRFKVRGKKIKAETFVGEERTKTTATKVDASKLVPPTKNLSEDIKAEVDENNQEVLIPLSSSLTEIEKNLEKILELNEDRLDLEKQSAKDLETRQENLAFKEKEKELEGASDKSKTKDRIAKVIAPAKSIIDTIIDFFLNILLGSAVVRLLDIIQNPGKYLKGLIDFGNKMIDFINEIIKYINDVILLPINTIINSLNDVFNNIESAVNQIARFLPIDPIDLPEIDPIAIKYIDPIKYPDWIQQQEGGGMVVEGVQQQEGGGTVINVKNLSFEKGGAIDRSSGITISGLGNDTQLIAAQPGEIMMSKRAVDAYGADNLLAANAAAGGNNKPKFGRIPGFQGGGQVGKLVIGAGHAPSEENAMKGIALGSDGRPVQGTQDIHGSKVNEWEATRHLVKALKKLVSNSPYRDRISFQNITSYKGLKGVPSSVEKQSGTQFVDLHFDARGGRGGVLNPDRSKISSVDRSMAAVFGNYPGVTPQEKGVTAVGGTILEVAAIDDPSIGQFLGEVKKGTVGKESMNLASKVLNSMLPGLSGGGAMEVPPPAPILPSPTSIPSTSISPLQKTTPPKAPSTSSPSGQTSVLPLPTGGQGAPSSGASPSQRRTPGFSAEDLNNADLIVVKSIYNIVG